MGWILALSMLGLLGIAVHVICLLGFKAEESLVVIGSWMLLFLPVLLLWTVGVGVWSYLFRRYQDKLWLELGDLLDIADEATIALHEQNPFRHRCRDQTGRKDLLKNTEDTEYRT